MTIGSGTDSPFVAPRRAIQYGCATRTHVAHALRQLSMSNRPFAFTVQHVFYIKPPIDRVMLVGVVDQGAVRPGDAVVIEGSGRAMRATVEAIEGLRVGQLPSAETGDQVALRFADVPADQVKAGDHVSSDRPLH